MINDPVVLRGVGKYYRIYSSPSDRLKGAFYDQFKKIFEFNRNGFNDTKFYKEYWALRDINLELKPGEAIGILGRNGAGKSTLLQIIAGTLSASTGVVKTNGNITALLELGSGFSPEFTGRENIFLSGSIFGLTKKQIKAIYVSIVDFADIGDFIDQPIKTYSSGMVMRLAFAVHTAIKPSVLIIDEALAVGDMFFQAKCMDRLKQLRHEGVTLLFVSHDTSVVRQICDRAILLEKGRIVEFGDVSKVCDAYQKLDLEERNATHAASILATEVRTNSPVVTLVRNGAEVSRDNTPLESDSLTILSGKQLDEDISSFVNKNLENRVGNGSAEIVNVFMESKGKRRDNFEYDEEVVIKIFIKFIRNLSNFNQVIKVRTVQGTDILFFDVRLHGALNKSYEADATYLFEWEMRLPLQHGTYLLSAVLSHPPLKDQEDWVFIDSVPIAYQFTVNPRATGMISGLVTIPATLNVRKIAFGL